MLATLKERGLLGLTAPGSCQPAEHLTSLPESPAKPTPLWEYATSELVRVIKYGKPPSRMMVERFIDLMKLNKEESMYFILLSHYSVVGDGNKSGNEVIDTFKRVMFEHTVKEVN